MYMLNDLKLSKSPLIDAIVEIRFNNTAPSQVLAGLLYSKLQPIGYTEFEEMPLMQLPPALRDSDENLKYAAHYKIKSENFWVFVGATIVSVVAICKDNRYPGWIDYKAEIDKVFKQLFSLEMITALTRLNVRYINLFKDQNIYDRIELSLDSPFDDTITDDITHNFTISDNNASIQVVFSSTASITDSNNEVIKGSLLDMNWFFADNYTIEELDSLITRGHDKVEDIFKSVLEDNFMESLK